MGNASTRNVTSVFRSATSEQMTVGLAWYEEAHSLARTLAEAHGYTVETAAGVIAALSPITSWDVNKKTAIKFFEAGGLHTGYLQTGLTKARAILAGADPETTLLGTRGHKTAAFYHGIRTAGETDAVCVDRHAYDLATNQRNLSNTRPNLAGKRYIEVAEKYQRAAKILAKEYGPLHAAQVQAVTWVTWRQRYWSEGAFDG